VRVQMMKGEERRFTVVGISKESNAARGFIISIDDARDGFRSVQPMEAYIKVKDGASVDAVKGEVDTILQDSPEMSVATRSEYAGNSTSQFDFILYAVQILLLVAMAISVLGVINTLVLSVIERTRELGMLRAIGLRRSQTMRMITVESVVISLFGTLLGLIVGAGLGAAIVVALREALGFGEVALPWLLMAIYLVASLFIGVLAAVLPAIRAARLNVLGAIDAVTHELTTVVNDTVIDAMAVCELLGALAARYAGPPLKFVLDNARYQKCEAVRLLAAELGIELLYLPSYSPNLNLIERLWKFLRKKALSRWHVTFEAMQEAVAGVSGRRGGGPSLFKRPALYTALAGLAAVGVGAVLGMGAKDVRARAGDANGDGIFDVSRKERLDAQSQANLATALIAGGGVVAAGSVVWLVVVPTHRAASATSLEPGGGGGASSALHFVAGGSF